MVANVDTSSLFIEIIGHKIQEAKMEKVFS